MSLDSLISSRSPRTFITTYHMLYMTVQHLLRRFYVRPSGTRRSAFPAAAWTSRIPGTKTSAPPASLPLRTPAGAERLLGASARTALLKRTPDRSRSASLSLSRQGLEREQKASCSAAATQRPPAGPRAGAHRDAGASPRGFLRCLDAFDRAARVGAKDPPNAPQARTASRTDSGPNDLWTCSMRSPARWSSAPHSSSVRSLPERHSIMCRSNNLLR